MNSSQEGATCEIWGCCSYDDGDPNGNIAELPLGDARFEMSVTGALSDGSVSHTVNITREVHNETISFKMVSRIYFQTNEKIGTIYESSRVLQPP